MPLFIYLAVWLFAVVRFWFIDGSDAMGYAVLYLYILIPLATFCLSFSLGRRHGGSNIKVWFASIPLGLMHSLAGFLTFDLSNILSGGALQVIQLESSIVLAAVSLLGLAAGTLYSMLKKVSHE